MKKTYSKPGIVFESFSLSTSITSGCIITADQTVEAIGTGGIKAGKLVVFQNDAQGCITKVSSGWLNGFCYHNPVEFNNLFHS